MSGKSASNMVPCCSLILYAAATIAVAGPLLVLILLSLVTCGFVMFYRGSAWTAFLQMMYAPYAEYYLVVAAFVTFMGMLSYIWEVGEWCMRLHSAAVRLAKSNNIMTS